jgi:photosystem II stability/assembly factor-like uncharacterized protein
MIKSIISLCVVVVICCGCSNNSGAFVPNSTAAQSNNGSTQSPNAAAELRFKVPDGWVVEKPTSNMRVAQYKLPKVMGDADDGLLVLYYFGQGQGGTPQANIDRWIDQMKQPDGSSSKDKARTETFTANGLKVDTVDLLGNYSGGMSPDSAPQNSKAIYRLRAAIIDTPKGSYFVKLTGPEKTVGRWDRAYNEYIKSFEFK